MRSTVGVRSAVDLKYRAEASSSSWSRARHPRPSCSTWTCMSIATRESRSTSARQVARRALGGDEIDEHGVALGDEGLLIGPGQRAADAVDDRLLELVGPRRCLERSPPVDHRRAEVL